MTDLELELARFRIRLDVIQRLTLKTAFGHPVILGVLNIEESRDSLKDWMQGPLTGIEAAARTAVGDDPAKIALLSEEVREIVEDMTRFVDECAAELKKVSSRR